MSLLTPEQIETAFPRFWPDRPGDRCCLTADELEVFARAIEAATAAKYTERIAELEREREQFDCPSLSALGLSSPSPREYGAALSARYKTKIADLQAKLDAAAVDAELVSYILQDDIQNRLTPRVVDIAYSAFVIGRSGENKDDSGPCDWFNDTKPMVLERIGKIRKELSIDAMRTGEPKV